MSAQSIDCFIIDSLVKGVGNPITLTVRFFGRILENSFRSRGQPVCQRFNQLILCISRP